MKETDTEAGATTKITNVSQRVARDDGEFESIVSAAAWVSGAILAFQEAESIRVDIELKTKKDSFAPGSFMWSQPVWVARVEAYWREQRSTEESRARIDVTSVVQALLDVSSDSRER